MYYTIEEAAQILKVNPTTISEWVKEGRLKASKLAKTKVVRISEEHIKKFYEDNIVEI